MSDLLEKLAEQSPQSGNAKVGVRSGAFVTAEERIERLRTERQQAIDALQRLSEFCRLMRMPWDQASEAEKHAVKVLESLKQESPK